ncbi:hypothetical protein ACFL6U_06585 [Planctomycetota bacterium]
MRNRSVLWLFMTLLVQVLSAPAVLARTGRIGLGGLGGNSWTTERHEAKHNSLDWSDTQFDDSTTHWGNFGCLWDTSPSKAEGLQVGLQQFAMDFAEFGIKYGELDATPVMLNAKLRTSPKYGTGLAGHFGMGMGAIVSNFATSTSHTPRANATEVEAGESLAFAIGGGLDYIISKHLSLATTLQYMWATVNCSWDKASTVNSRMNVDRLVMSNLQLLVGLQLNF